MGTLISAYWTAATRRLVSEHRVFIALMFIALVLRLAWIRAEIPVLQGDECEYLRIAENVLHEHRYAGLYEGPQLVYPPLFPLLIALLSLVMPSVAAAGVSVAFLGGLALVAAVYALGRGLYGSRAGILAAALVAVHPTLIQLSGTIISQAIYLPLVVTGVVFAVQWVDGRNTRAGLLSGACFGLAYLTRPEALAGPLAIAAIFVAAARVRHSSYGKALVQTVPMLALVALIAAPYMAYLTVETGVFRVEDKSVMNYTMAQRISSGVDPDEAAFGLGPDLREEGPLLSVNRWIMAAPATIPRHDLSNYLVTNARRNAGPLRWTLLSADFGGYLMIALAAAGLLVRPPSRISFAREVLVLTIVVGYVVILLGQHVIEFRYVVPILPFLLVWAANGIRIVAEALFAGSSIAAAGSDSLRAAPQFGISFLLVLALVVPGADLSRGGDFRSAASQEEYRKEAGLWLAGAAVAPRTVMSTSNEVPYYARATAMRLPYATGERAMAYVRSKSPDYIVLIREPSTVGPHYYAEWLRKGIPDLAAHRVQVFGASDDPDVAIFRWGAVRRQPASTNPSS